MSAYENVVEGRLKLKGKGPDVKGDGISKKKKEKKHKINHSPMPSLSTVLSTEEAGGEFDAGKEEGVMVDDYLTPAERRYLQHWEKIDRQMLAKTATESHRDRTNHTEIGQRAIRWLPLKGAAAALQRL